MTRIGWKAFTLAAIASDGPQLTSVSVNAFIDVLVLIGLVGYSWGVKIGSRWMWRVVFLLETVGVIMALIFWAPYACASRATWPRDFAWAIVLGTAMSLGKIYALFRYGFSD